jgi:hypothetical protein
MPTGAELIAAERARQLADEGFTPDHDATLLFTDLARAGAAYALVTLDWDGCEDIWPWDEGFKPSCRAVDEECAAEYVLHDLVRAGALMAAAIDRLLRPC